MDLFCGTVTEYRAGWMLMVSRKRPQDDLNVRALRTTRSTVNGRKMTCERKLCLEECYTVEGGLEMLRAAVDKIEDRAEAAPVVAKAAASHADRNESEARNE